MTEKNTRRGETQKTENVVICPPCGEQSLAPEGFNPGVAVATKEGQNKKNALWPLLPRLTAVLPPQGREMKHTGVLPPKGTVAENRMKGNSGFTARGVIPQCLYAGYSGRMGFTLIELLVVVLIIGILAAVAVPQYQVAVAKSRYSNMVTVLGTIKAMQELYYLENGAYSDSVDEFPIGELQGCSSSKGGNISCSHFYVDMNAGYAFNNPYASLKEIGVSYIYFLNHSAVNPNQRECWAITDDEMANKVCKRMGGTEIGNRSWTASFPSYTWKRYSLQ